LPELSSLFFSILKFLSNSSKSNLNGMNRPLFQSTIDSQKIFLSVMLGMSISPAIVFGGQFVISCKNSSLNISSTFKYEFTYLKSAIFFLNPGTGSTVAKISFVPVFLDDDHSDIFIKFLVFCKR
jgi:hypothetical protein